MKQIIVIVLAVLMMACTAQQETTSSTPPSNGQPSREGNQPPSVEEMFTQMDANKDGKLAKTEVKGPLEKDFAKIDANGDGFISKEELQNAPKPERGQKPPRQGN